MDTQLFYDLWQWLSKCFIVCRSSSITLFRECSNNTPCWGCNWCIDISWYLTSLQTYGGRDADNMIKYQKIIWYFWYLSYKGWLAACSALLAFLLNLKNNSILQIVTMTNTFIINEKTRVTVWCNDYGPMFIRNVYMLCNIIVMKRKLQNKIHICKNVCSTFLILLFDYITVAHYTCLVLVLSNPIFHLAI